MMRYAPILLLILVLINACKDDEEPGIEVFTVEFEEGYLPQQTDNWIIISSTNGELLDYQWLQAGIIPLQATEIPADNKLNVSLLNRGTSSPGSNFLSMTTYTGIEVGESWSFQAPQITIDPEIGNANVQIMNLPPIETVGITFQKNGRAGSMPRAV